MSAIEYEINFRLLFETIPGSYIVIKPDFLIISISDDFETAFNVRREMIIGQPFFTIFFNSTGADTYGAYSNIHSSLSSVIKSKKSKIIPAQRYDVQNTDGTVEVKYWSTVIKPILNSKNKIDFLILHVKDISNFIQLQKEDTETEKKTDGFQLKNEAIKIETTINLAEIKNLNLALQNRIVEKTQEIVHLNKSISIFNLMLDSAYLLAITDTKGTIKGVNENFSHVTKYSKEELVGQKFSIFNSDYHSLEFIEGIESTIRQGNIWKGEIREKARDDRYFWLDTTIIPFIDESGLPTEYLTIQLDITDKKNAIELIKASEKSYRDFFENSLVPMFTVDMITQKNLSVNDKGVELFGYQSKQDFLDNYDPVKHSLTPAERGLLLRKLKIHGKIEKGIAEFKKLDGTHFWVNFFLKLNNVKQSVEVILIDITEQIKFQRELLASKEKYQTIFENSAVAIYSFDLDSHQLIEVNEKGVQLAGYKSKKEILKKLKPEDLYLNIKDSVRHIKILKENGEINNEVIELKKLDGKKQWASLFMKRDIQNNLLQILLLEITQQILQQQALQSSEEKHRNIYENSLVAMHTTNLHTLKKIEVNDLCVALYGYKSQADFLNNYDPDFHFVRPVDKMNLLKILHKKGEIRNAHYEMKKLNGQHFWAKVFIKLNTEKEIFHALIIDITSQVKNKENLEIKVKERTVELGKMLTREQGVSEMKSRFLSMASHEFRTPLSSILSSIYLIQMYSQTDQQDKRVTHINRIASSVKDLTDILQNFLSLEKLKKGILEVNSNEFNLPETLTNIIGEMEEIINKKHQRITYTHDGEEIVEQSENVLKNILLNLLTNASKYSGDYSEIRISSNVLKKQVIISVVDEGVGIPEKDQKNLFNEFFRAGNVNNIHGTGLGLCIVKKYTELIEGNISFTSELNKGSTFTIKFPQKLKLES